MRHRAALELAGEWATLTDLAALVRALPRLDRVVTYDRLWIEHPTRSRGRTCAIAGGRS